MQRALATLGFGIGFAAAWFAAAVTQLPLLWYFPLERRWAFATTVLGLGMDYFGRLLLGAAVGALGAGLGRLLARRASPRWLLHGSIWLGTLVGLNFVYQLAALLHRNPTPLNP